MHKNAANDEPRFRVVAVEYTRDERELLRAYRALPACEREEVLRLTVVRSLRWRSAAPEPATRGDWEAVIGAADFRRATRSSNHQRCA